MRRFLGRLWADDRGVETFEWIALALVMLTLLGAVWAFMKAQGGALVAYGLAASVQRWVNSLTNGPGVPPGGPAQGGGTGYGPSGGNGFGPSSGWGSGTGNGSGSWSSPGQGGGGGAPGSEAGSGSSFGWGNGSSNVNGPWSSSGYGGGSGVPGSGASSGSSSGGHSIWSSIGHGINWFLHNGGPVGSAISNGFQWIAGMTPQAFFSSHVSLLDKAGALFKLGAAVGLGAWGALWVGRILSVAGGLPWLGSIAKTAAVGVGNAILDGIGSVAGGVVGAGEIALGLAGSAGSGVAKGIGWLVGKASDAVWLTSEAATSVKDGVARRGRSMRYRLVSFVDGWKGYWQGAWGAFAGTVKGIWWWETTPSGAVPIIAGIRAMQVAGRIAKAYRQGRLLSDVAGYAKKHVLLPLVAMVAVTSTGGLIFLGMSHHQAEQVGRMAGAAKVNVGSLAIPFVGEEWATVDAARGASSLANATNGVDAFNAATDGARGLSSADNAASVGAGIKAGAQAVVGRAKAVANKTLSALKRLNSEGLSGTIGKIDGVTGQLTGSLDGLTADERTVVNDLLGQGKNVEIVPRSTGKTPDFKVDGVPTELKTLKGNSLNTAVTRIQRGFKQGAQTVIIDARQTGITTQQAEQVLKRAAGSYGAKGLPGQVEIWTQLGVVKS